MTTAPCHILLLALCLGCVRSPLPADTEVRPPAPTAGAGGKAPLEAVALAGPGLRGLELARLPERPLTLTPPPFPAPVLAEIHPAPELVDKGSLRRGDPPPTQPGGEVARERRSFLRPALPQEEPARAEAPPSVPQAETLATPDRGAQPAQPIRTQAPPLAKADQPVAARPAVPPVQAEPVPPAPEREVLASASRLEAHPAAPSVVAARTSEPGWTSPPAPPREAEVAQRPSAMAEPAREPDETRAAEVAAEAARPMRPTAPPDARFQVQIMSASDPEGVDDMRLQAELVFPDEVVEVVWDPPYYKVRVGAEATQEAAVELKRRALRLGFQNAWVVPRRQP